MLDIRAGSRVGPYKVIAPLEEAARGGMSTLFMAQLARVEGTQLVVIKLVPVSEGEGEGVGLFELSALRKEVGILRTLRHPNIVKIYPIPSRTGRREHYILRATNVPGNPWFCAMEYLAGGSLESRFQEVPIFPAEEAVEVAYQIGSALDYMHAKQYVHWDVKPDNILFRTVRSEGGEVQVVLTDYGIARGTHEPAVVAGSVRYMSPERLRIHMGEIGPDQIMDQRPADVYALGVVLYEMLAGNLPFVSEGGEEGIKHAIISEAPIPLSDFNYDVPLLLEDIIFQAMEKDPANRPTMEELVTLLDKAVPAPRVGVSALAPSAEPGEAAMPGATRARAAPSLRGEERDDKPKPKPKRSLFGILQQWALIVVAAVALLIGGPTIVDRVMSVVAPTETPTPTPTPDATATAHAEELQVLEQTAIVETAQAEVHATTNAAATAAAEAEATAAAEAEATAAAEAEAITAAAEATAAFELTQTAEAPTPTYTPRPATRVPPTATPLPTSPPPAPTKKPKPKATKPPKKP